MTSTVLHIFPDEPEIPFDEFAFVDAFDEYVDTCCGPDGETVTIEYVDIEIAPDWTDLDWPVAA